MSLEIDPKIIKTTQDLLSKIVKKPVVTDKLLKRPPFRFIHDLICSIIKTHGFLKDLYSEEEMVAENIKDKDSKISFLQKAIDTTGFIAGDVIPVKASKIVAGLETDKTNQWLQTLAKVVIAKKDSSDAVERVLNGEKPTKQKNIATNNSNTKKKTANVNTNNTNNTNTNTRIKAVPKETKPEAKPRIKRETSPLMQTIKEKPLSPKEISDTSALNGNSSKPSSASDHTNSGNNEEKVQNQVLNGVEAPNEEVIVQPQVIVESTPPEEPIQIRPKTAAKSAIRKNINYAPEVTARPPTRQETRERVPRPSSSRPAPPRIMSKTIEDNKIVEAELEEKLRLLNAKPVQNLITENLKSDDDEDFIIDSVKSAEDDLGSNERLGFDNSIDTQKGSLVKQLIDTKKELEGNESTEVANNDKNLIRLANRDIENLRQSIQSLSQTANPLGKVLDYLQEDIDTMLSELKSWQEEYKHNMQILEKSRITINDDLEPYKSELNQLDSDINEQLEKISATKANLIRNEEKLHKMVTIINRTL